MSDVYVVFELAQIESYYNVEIFLGVFDSEEKANFYIAEREKKLIFKNWTQTTFYNNFHELSQTDENYLNAKEELRKVYQDQKPTFDQSKSKDREYVKEHTQRKQEWNKIVHEYQKKEMEERNRLFKIAQEFSDDFCAVNFANYLSGDMDEIRKLHSIDGHKIEKKIINHAEMDV